MELLLILMVGIGLMMFLTMRKQKRTMQEQQALQDSLEYGDRVMTTMGLYATVVDTSDDTTIDLEIADGLVTTWLRQAVREKVGPDLDEYDEEEEYADADDAPETDADEAADEEHTDDTQSDAKLAPPLEHDK